MLRGEGVNIDGDGEQTRDFVYVGDVAEAHSVAQEKERSMTVNIGSTEGISINTLFRLMAEESSYRLLPEYREERPGDVKHVVLDNSRAKRQLGWEPQTTLVEGLRRTIASIGLQE
jgi:UDP-glucose 4-epimerase